MKKHLRFSIFLCIFLFAANKSLFAQCTNADFEDGTLGGWTGTWGFGTFCLFGSNIPNPYLNAGINQGPLNGGSFPASQKNHFIMNSGNDANLAQWGYNLPVVWPGGGLYSALLGNTTASGEGESMSYSFLVTANNCNFTYHFQVVIGQGTALSHLGAATQPYFNIKMVDGSNNPIACADYQVDGLSAASIGGFTTIPGSVTGNDDVLFKPWSSVVIPLNAYIGQTVKITFTTRACYPACGGSHYCYAFIDAECAPLQIVAPSVAICGGNSITLTAPAGAATYAWTGPGVIPPTNTQVVNVNQPGTYTVTMTTFGNTPCTFSLDTLVVANPGNPVANFSATTACAGSPTTFTDLSTPLGSIATWAWDFNNNGTINSTSQNPTYTFAGFGTYPVKLTVGWPPCTHDTTINVVVSPSPTSSFTTTSPVCAGVNSTITYTGNAPANASYTWNFAGGTVVSGSGQGPYQVNWTTGGTKNITLTVTQGLCSSVVTTVPVIVNAAPVVTVSPDVVICTGSNTTLTAAGATTYVWAPGTGLSATTGTSVTANPVSTTTYAVTGTTAGCTDSASVTVTVGPLPTSTFTTVSPVCALANSTITYTGNAPANATYSWNFAGGTIVSGSGQGPYQVNWPAGTGTPNITLTVTVGTCVSTVTTVPVTVNPSPVVTVSPDIAICAGSSTLLTANGATGYVWAPGTGLNATNTANVTANPVNTTTYSVTGTTSGCSDSASVTVTVNPVPTSTFTLTSPICQGVNTPVNYTGNAPANATYTWDFSNTTVVSGSGQGPYVINWPGGTGTNTITLSVTLNNCTSPVTSITATVNPTPAVTVSPDVAICAGGNTMLTAAGATTYVWAPATGLSGTTGATVTATPASTITYAVTGTSAGCSDSASVTVTVNPVATVSVNSPSVCLGNPATLTAVPSLPGGTYSWAPGGQTAVSISVSPVASTPYTVSYITACGTATATSNVTVWPLPGVTLTAENPLCGANNTGVILVTVSGGAAPYDYSINGAVAQLPDSFTSLTPGFYTVAVRDANGCNGGDTISVLSSTAVTISLAATGGSCGGNNGQIIVTGGGGQTPYQYSLNGGAYQASNTFGNLASGFYTVQVKDATGCTATDTTSLPQGIPLSVTIAADSVTCFGASNGRVTATASGGLPPYQFSLNAGPFQGEDSFIVAVGTYTITIQDQAGCTATTPAITVFQPSLLVFDSIVPTAVKCVGDKNGTITVYSSGGTPPFNFSCTQDFTNFDFATNGPIIGLDTGFYSVILSDNNGCTITDTTTVRNAVPDFYTITTDTTSCYGTQYHDGVISITGLPLSNGGFRYSIDGTNFQTTAFDSLTAGLYNVTAKDTNGCSTYFPNVVVPEPPKAFASVLPTDTSLQLGQSIQLSTSFWPFPTSTIVSYGWTPLPGLSCIDCPNPVLTSYAHDNTYTVTVTYNNNCTVDASITVLVTDNPQIFIPNSFTPNGDGNNDIFLVYGANIKTIELKIFNRWGELVFETKNQFQGWDGTYKGQLQNPAVFAYETTVTLLDDKQVFKKGTVTLVR